MTAYRQSQLIQYASLQQGRTSPVTPREISEFGKSYSHYLRNWLPHRKDARILDTGCGAGLLLGWLKGQGFTSLTGVDASPSQVVLAREIVPEITEGNALKFINEKDSCYEMIIALDFFEHLTKDEALKWLENSFKALAPGGRIVLQTPNGESPWVGNVLYGDLTHENCYTPHLMEKLLKGSGFEQIEYRPCGPAPTGFQGMVRSMIWAGITITCRILNIVEGAVTAGIYSRVFLISGKKTS